MDDESDFLNAKVDELQRAPDVTSDHAAGVMDIVGDRHKQAQRLRPWFLLAAFVLAAASVATSCGVIIWYIVHAGQQADSAVLVGFFTSTVLETLGILYIIARYCSLRRAPHTLTRPRARGSLARLECGRWWAFSRSTRITR